MDYLASEIPLKSEYLNKISYELAVMNRQNNNSTISTQTNLQRIWDKRVVENKRLLKKIDKIPVNAFKFEGMQEIGLGKDKLKECRRYELKTPFEALSYYLILSYCIIKNNLRIEGYCPSEISIELNKGEILENTVNIHLTKDNVDNSIILQFADIVDYLDLEIEWFILWADPNTNTQKQKRRAISGKTRQNVLMRDNYTCQICGATVKDGAKLEIDHIIPVSKGGTNKEDNLQVLCQQCNREKHNREDLLHDKQKLAELNGTNEFEDICEDILMEMHWYQKEVVEDETPMGYLREEMIEVKNEDKLSFEKSIEKLIEKGICYYPTTNVIKMVGDYRDMLDLVKMGGK